MGHLGVRAAVLVTVTALALAAPWPLARRRLSSTAETVAFIGLVLVPLSGLAVANAVIGHSSDPGGLNESGSGGAGLWPVVAGTAALAALWAGYARAAPLRLPGPTALAIAHVPLPLAAYEAGPTPAGAALALLLTAALDLAVRWFARERAGSLERAVAEVAGLFAGLVGAAVALAASFAADGPAAGLRASGVLALAVALAWVCAGSGDGQEVRAAFSAGAGTAAAAALAAPAAKALPVRWAPAVYAVAACAVLASAARLPERTRPGVAGAGAVALGLAAVAVAPDVVAALVGPLGAFGGMWSGHAPVWTGRPAAPAVMAVAALAAGGLAFRREVRALPGAARDGCRIAAVLCAASAVVAVPGAAGSRARRTPRCCSALARCCSEPGRTAGRSRSLRSRRGRGPRSPSWPPRGRWRARRRCGRLRRRARRSSCFSAARPRRGRRPSRSALAPERSSRAAGSSPCCGP
ncbi:hypothetical protein [Actinomadura sp. J1-007]|uniref:hypothetical protein n=1 Tax=Actinomadura sp. J1-007 TaxID=2661913 RepID=UPI0035CCEAA0